MHPVREMVYQIVFRDWDKPPVFLGNTQHKDFRWHFDAFKAKERSPQDLWKGFSTALEKGQNFRAFKFGQLFVLITCFDSFIWEAGY